MKLSALLIDSFEVETIAETVTNRLFYLVLMAFVAWALLATGGPTEAAAAAIVLACFLVMVSFIDLKHMILPDILVIPGLFAGLALAPWLLGHHWLNTLLGALIGFGVFWAVHWGFYKIRGYHGLGFGDVKFLAMLGAWVGAMNLPLVVLLSSLIAIGVFVLRRVLVGTATSRPLPYGPFLALAAWLSLLYADSLWLFLLEIRNGGSL